MAKLTNLLAAPTLTARAWGWLIMAVVLIALGAGLTSKLWRPLLQHAQAQTETARDDASARGVELRGSQEVTARADVIASDEQQQRDAANDLNTQAAKDPAAQVRLPPSVRARMSDGDRRLCDAGKLRCN